MPLTKPICESCDYNLRGIDFGTMCPECGCTERKLLFEGSSRVLTWLAIVLGTVTLLSIAVMLVNIIHIRLFPNVKSDWLNETTHTLRVGLRPSLIVGAFGVFILSYLVMLWDSVHHNVTRVRLLQMVICMSVCALAMGVAAIWVY